MKPSWDCSVYTWMLEGLSQSAKGGRVIGRSIRAI